jgi:hypothetical protein
MLELQLIVRGGSDHIVQIPLQLCNECPAPNVESDLRLTRPSTLDHSIATVKNLETRNWITRKDSGGFGVG